MIPLVLLIITLYTAVINYPGLPENIPIDFDSKGMVDDWAGKEMVFFYPGISTLIYAVFSAIGISMAVINDPKRLINMPRQWKDRLTAEDIESLRPMLIRFLYILKIVIMGMMAYLLYSSVEIAMGRAASVDSLPLYLFTLGIIGITGLLMWKLFRLVFTREE
ncbi:DUF1648 domain-containing protein [Chloroflexota bacterium]